MSTFPWWTTLDQMGFATTGFLSSAFWQSSILFVAVIGLSWLLRGRHPTVRQRLWIVSLLVAPILPFITLGARSVGAPQQPLSVLPAYVRPIRNPELDSRNVESSLSHAVSQTEVRHSSSPGPYSTARTRTTQLADSQLRVAKLLEFPWALALLAYATVLAAFVGFIVIGRVRIRQWIHLATPCEDERVCSAFRRARRMLGFRRDPQLLESDRVPVPISAQTIKPRILLPKGLAESLSNDDLLAIALHETAHLRRHEPFTLVVVALVRAVFFFHPLVWLAAHRISTLAEQSADEEVLRCTRKPLSYAKLLARLAEKLPRRPLSLEMAVGLVLGKSAFLRRVEAILSDRRGQVQKLTRVALATSVVAILLSIGLAASLPLAEKEQAAVASAKLVLENPGGTNPKDRPQAMVPIPAGRFEMGIDEEDLEELVEMGTRIPHMRMAIARTWWSNEMPRHTVKVDSFYMDTHEVTNAQFGQFVRETGYKAEGHWQKYAKKDRIAHPVVNVTWNDAKTYAKWAGKRLPTEAEWEYAAKGGKNVKWFPWGDTPDPTKANYQHKGETIFRDLRERILGKKINTKAVGSYEPNGYGLFDILGNVEEWCEDAYKPYLGGLPWNHEIYKKPWGSRRKWSESQKVIRGGHWGSLNPAYMRITKRSNAYPDDSSYFRGFRCAKSRDDSAAK